MNLNKDIIIDLEQVIEDYNKVLTSTSRGFDTRYEFLEAWVPSENKVNCILDLISVAKEYSINSLVIQLNAKLIDDLKKNEDFKLKMFKTKYNFDDLNLKIYF